MDGRMCSGLVDSEEIKIAFGKITDKHDWYSASDFNDSIIACELLDLVPGITGTTTADLDELTDANFHTAREVIETLQKEYEDFLKVEKEYEFKKYRKC